MKMRGEHVALVGVLAAMIIAAGYIKLTPILGATSYQFSMGSVAIHLVAILLGPVLGTLTAFVGATVGQLLTGQGVAFPLFIPAAIGALVSALLYFSYNKVALAVMSATLLVWYAFPVGREAWYFPFMLVMAIAAIGVFGGYISKMAHGTNEGHRSIAIFAICLSGLLCDQLAGSILAIPIFGLTADMYLAVLFIYPVERVLMAIATAVIAVPVLRALKASSLSILSVSRTESEASQLPIQDE